jgi:hypothetical protein
MTVVTRKVRDFERVGVEIRGGLGISDTGISGFLSGLTMPPFEDSPLLDSCEPRGLRVLTAASELTGRQVAK